METLVPPTDGVVERCSELADIARRLGYLAAADRFLLVAWAAFEGVELPAAPPARPRSRLTHVLSSGPLLLLVSSL